MPTRWVVICIALALGQLGKPVTTSDIKDMLIRVFDASNKENINKVFTVQTKDNEIIFESADAKTARSADGRPENTVEIMVGSHGDKPALHTITNDSGGVEVKSKAQW